MTILGVGRSRFAIACNLGILYFGKISGVFVTFVFLPIYARELGPHQFGVIAVILSMQALLTMLDLGMAVIIGRELSLGSDSAPRRIERLVRSAELVLTIFYVAMLWAAILLKFFGIFPSLSTITVLGAIVLFWVLVLQNLYYTGTIARRHYTAGSTVQVIGIVTRAAATAWVLMNVSATIEAFVVTQLIFSIAHLAATRTAFNRLMEIRHLSLRSEAGPMFREALGLIKRGRPIALFALAGAAVMQLDKPIVSAFISTAGVAPYFLATTLCMVPISVLAGPVSQYYQPLLLRALSHADGTAIKNVIRQFTFGLLGITLLPSLVFWMFRDPLISLWLGESPLNSAISAYVAILLPGFTVGALGYIPYSMLLSAQDFRFQAVLSTALTVCTLAGAVICASANNVEALCYVYAMYHGISTALSWMRAIWLPATRSVALTSGSIAIATVLMVGSIIGLYLLTRSFA